MEEHTAASSGTPITVGARNHDNPWVIVAIVDPAIITASSVFDRVD